MRCRGKKSKSPLPNKILHQDSFCIDAGARLRCATEKPKIKKNIFHEKSNKSRIGAQAKESNLARLRNNLFMNKSRETPGKSKSSDRRIWIYCGEAQRRSGRICCVSRNKHGQIEGPQYTKKRFSHKKSNTSWIGAEAKESSYLRLYRHASTNRGNPQRKKKFSHKNLNTS